MSKGFYQTSAFYFLSEIKYIYIYIYIYISEVKDCRLKKIVTDKFVERNLETDVQFMTSSERFSHLQCTITLHDYFRKASGSSG